MHSTYEVRTATGHTIARGDADLIDLYRDHEGAHLVEVHLVPGRGWVAQGD